MRLRWKAAATAAITTGFVLANAASAFAQAVNPALDGGGTPSAELSHTDISINLLFVVIGAILVIFMQAGFALVETGFCRAKHAAHVVTTNFAIFGLGFVAFMAIGFPIMFGGFSYGAFGMNEAIGGPLIGSGNWVFLWKGPLMLIGDKAGTVAVLAFFLYMVAFMDTVATIPTGSMAERWKFKSFMGWGIFCGAIYYPIFGAWTWGGGWLAKTWDTMSLGAGYVDFAGSGVVHAMGGVAALAGAIVLGPRIGKYGKNGEVNTLAAHHIPMAMLGTFILLFGWFGFNAASTFAVTDNRFATVAANTAIAAAFGATVALVYIFWKTGKPDPGMAANGMLAGLVAITAPCAFVEPWAAALIGSIAAVLVIHSILFIDRVLKIDDPVGAISVHGVNGLFGVLAVGIFANGDYGAAWNGSTSEGIKGALYGDWGQLGAQALGAVVIIVFGGGLAFAFFKIQDKLTKGGIRSDEFDELTGLDETEMGVLAYGFHVIDDGVNVENSGDKVGAGKPQAPQS
ncbi:MAG: ammonium transporter [Mycobacteriales bacterium]